CQVLSLLLTVRFFLGDGGTRVSSESCPGVGFSPVTPHAPAAVSAAASSIDGHAMTAKPITTEKKWSDVFFLMLVERAARVAVVTTLPPGGWHTPKILAFQIRYAIESREQHVALRKSFLLRPGRTLPRGRSRTLCLLSFRL